MATVEWYLVIGDVCYSLQICLSVQCRVDISSIRRHQDASTLKHGDIFNVGVTRPIWTTKRILPSTGVPHNVAAIACKRPVNDF